MEKIQTVDEYFANVKFGKEMLLKLRELLVSTELEENIKWGCPVYSLNGKNIAGLASFKSYVGLWFYQGALMADKAGVLINAQEDKTRALRQWRFNNAEEIDHELALDYIREAIDNQKSGKEIKADRSKPITIPDELADAFLKDPSLKLGFSKFSTGKKREFTDYISEPKRQETRLMRLEKVIPLILEGISLNDKYRNKNN